jgi:TPR repeat protein
MSKAEDTDIQRKASEWKAHFLPLAEEGDPTAQIAVAWEYWRGEYFPRDLKKSEEIFRSAENRSWEITIFNLMKMYYIEKSDELLYLFKER